MALATSTVWEVRTTGSDLNGGGFNPARTGAGTDYSQQDAAQVSYTDLVIQATTTNVSSAANPFTSAHVGNILSINNNFAAQFNGTSQYLSVSNNTFQTGNVSFTWAAWVMFDSLASGFKGIVGKDSGASANREYNFGYDVTTNRFMFGVGSTGTSVSSVSANSFGAATTGVWYFVVCWHDSVAGTVNIQINNGTVDSANRSATPYTTTQALNIGRVGSGGSYLGGRIDRVAFWKRTLTSGERTTLYNSGAGLAIHQITAGLKASLIEWWDLDEASGARTGLNAWSLTDTGTVTQKPGVGGVVGFTAGKYEVVSVAGGVATLDRAAGTANSTGGIGKLGGALASPGCAAYTFTNPTATGQMVWIKAGTYPILWNGAKLNGTIISVAGNNYQPGRWRGYETVRGDWGARPVLQLDSTFGGSVAVTMSGNYSNIEWVDVDCNAVASSTGFSLTGYHTRAIWCGAYNFKGQGFNVTVAAAEARSCYAHDSSGAATAGFNVYGGASAWGCVAKNITGPGFYVTNNQARFSYCLAWNCGTSLLGAFTGNNQNSMELDHCVSYLAVGNGFDVGSGNFGRGVWVANCVAWGSTKNGYATASVSDIFLGYFFNNAAGGSGGAYQDFDSEIAAATSAQAMVSGSITLTAIPFTDAPAGDFSLNDTSGGGATLKAAGLDPFSRIFSTTASNPDIGMAQSAGGGPAPAPATATRAYAA